MSDNTVLPVPQTQGDTIACDDISGVKFQKVKLIHGDVIQEAVRLAMIEYEEFMAKERRRRNARALMLLLN